MTTARAWGRRLLSILRPNIPPAIAPAAFFAMVTALGVLMRQQSELAEFSVLLFFGALIVLFLILLPLCAACFALLDRLGQRKSALAAEGSRVAFPSLAFFVVLLLLWTPWFMHLYPGSIAFDTGTSILDFLGLTKHNIDNPILQNVIFGGVYLLGDRFFLLPNNAIFLYCCLQAVLFAAVIASFLGFFSRRGVSSLLLWGIVFFMVVVPVFPVYAFVMGKDSNFTLVLLFILRQMLDLTVREDRVPLWRKAVLCCSMVLLCFLRNGAAALMIPTLLLLAVLYRPHRLFALISTVILVSANIAVPALVRLPAPNSREYLSIPVQQMAYTMKHDAAVTPEEREAVNRYFTDEELALYDRDTADPLKNLLGSSLREAGKTQELLGVWVSLGLRHPASYLKALYLSSCAYYLPGHITVVKPRYIIGSNISRQVYEKTSLVDMYPPVLFRVRSYCTSFEVNPLLKLPGSIGLYAWGLLLLLAYAIARRHKPLLVLTLPCVLVLIACCFSPINGYIRYAIGFIFAVPVLVPAALIEKNWLTKA